MNRCERCDVLPATMAGEGTLYLAPPLGHTRCKLRGRLERRGIAFGQPDAYILAIPVTSERLRELGAELAEELGAGELRDTKSLWVAEGTSPTLSDLMGMQSLSTLIAKVEGGWLVEMIRERRLTSHFQPIVSSRDRRAVFAHECLLRGREPDGSLVPPDRMYEAARSAELLFALDRAARLTAIGESVRNGVSGRLFINFNPSSIYDPAYCLRSTVAAIQEAEIDPALIVFEVVESDRSEADLVGILKFYREAGFGVALDDLGAGYGSLNLLNDLRPNFVKLDMKLIRDVHRDPYKAGITSKLIEMAATLGIGSVAEGVETEEEWDWLSAQGVDYVQGFLIARPASPPRAPRPAMSTAVPAACP